MLPKRSEERDGGQRAERGMDGRVDDGQETDGRGPNWERGKRKEMGV